MSPPQTGGRGSGVLGGHRYYLLPPISRNFQVLREGASGVPQLGVSLGRRPGGLSWGRCGWLRGWARDLGAPDVVAGRGSPSSPSLSSAPLLLVSLADAAARGGGSSRGTCGRERG